MALFGKSTAESLLKRLQDTSTPVKNMSEVLDGLRFSADFSLEQHSWLFYHPQKVVRSFAASESRTLSSRVLGDSLAKAMITQASEIRRELAAVIHTVAAKSVMNYLSRFMTAKEGKELDAGLDLIECSPDFKEYLGHLKSALRDPLAKVRHRAARILGKDAQDQTISLILFELLHDEDATMRHIVIEALSKNPTPDIIEPFFHRLAHEGPDTRSVMVRALRQLTKGGSQRRLEKELLPILADEDPQIRDLAVKILSELPDQLRVLRSFLEHCAGLAFWLRERSIESIQKVSSDLVPALAELIADENEDVRVGALQMVGLTNDPRLYPAIRDHFLSDRDWWERSMSAESLGNFRSDEVTAVLLQRVEDPSLRYCVIPALGKHENPAALHALFSCLNDPNRGIRLITLDTLSSVRRPEVIEAIRRMGMIDTDEDVRVRAADALRTLRVDDNVLLHRIETGMPSASVPAHEELGLEMANDSLNE